jgi:hypothetical protein
MEKIRWNDFEFFVWFFFTSSQFSLMEIPELRKSERIRPGLQPVARNLFSEDLLPIGKFKGFSQDIFRIFHLFQPGASNLRPKQNSNKNSETQREFRAFSHRFWHRAGARDSDSG